MLAFAVKLLSYSPAVGLVGLAAYHALTNHDLTAAGQDLAQAFAALGLGAAVHLTQATSAKS